MSEPLTGWVHGRTVALDAEAPELEGKHLRVVLEPIDDLTASGDMQSAEQYQPEGAVPRWLREHRGENPGKWVALQGDRLVAVASNAREAYAMAREQGIETPLVELVEPEEEGAVWGGWV